MEATGTVFRSNPSRKSNREQERAEALSRAIHGQSFGNFPAIFHGFAEKGIPESEIRPRENVFTYDAWRALGRYVRKGEHGVKVATIISCERENKETGEKETYTRPWTTTVFHVSQTEAIDGGAR